MKRRDFVTASLGASVLPSNGPAAASEGARAEGPPANVRPQLIELRRYRFRFGAMEGRWSDYAKGILIPAMNRAGARPVGAFSVLVGSDAPSITLLIPHPDPDSVVTLAGRIAADPEYKSAAGAFRSLPASDPPYVRRESSLMLAFDAAPTIEVPAGPRAAPSRIFELRTYESHNETAGLKKVEMFEKAGEIAIFRRVGLTPVFFARNLIGPGLPSLTYMLVFADSPAREKGWKTFREDPEWVKLRATPGYANAEILSNIHNLLLRPAEFSQI